MRFILSFAFIILVSCSKPKVIEITVKNPMKLCFFGDGGTGSEAQKEVARLLEHENCQAYFYLGDIIYPKGISSAKDPRMKTLFWEVYRPIFEKSPMFLMMGNHDYHGNVDAWLDVAKKHPNLHYPAHYYMARINDLCFPVMNTTDFKARQLFWFSSLDFDGCKASVLVGHHPAKSSGKHEKPYFPLNLFLDYALSYGQAYIAGHDHHLSYEGKYQGVDQFVSGAAGQLRAVDKEKAVWAKSQLGYMTLTASGNKAEVAFWGLKEEGGKEELFSKEIFARSLAND
ncbi:MAG: metallophosphoesterase [Bacteriovoracaceae bacterium]